MVSHAGFNGSIRLKPEGVVQRLENQGKKQGSLELVQPVFYEKSELTSWPYLQGEYTQLFLTPGQSSHFKTKEHRLTRKTRNRKTKQMLSLKAYFLRHF